MTNEVDQTGGKVSAEPNGHVVSHQLDRVRPGPGAGPMPAQVDGKDRSCGTHRRCDHIPVLSGLTVAGRSTNGG